MTLGDLLFLARWKAISDNLTLSLACGSTIGVKSKSALFEEGGLRYVRLNVTFATNISALLDRSKIFSTTQLLKV